MICMPPNLEEELERATRELPEGYSIAILARRGILGTVLRCPNGKDLVITLEGQEEANLRVEVAAAIKIANGDVDILEDTYEG